jgi:hypothetical protein
MWLQKFLNLLRIFFFVVLLTYVKYKHTIQHVKDTSCTQFNDKVEENIIILIILKECKCVYLR